MRIISSYYACCMFSTLQLSKGKLYALAIILCDWMGTNIFTIHRIAKAKIIRLHIIAKDDIIILLLISWMIYKASMQWVSLILLSTKRPYVVEVTNKTLRSILYRHCTCWTELSNHVAVEQSHSPMVLFYVASVSSIIGFYPAVCDADSCMELGTSQPQDLSVRLLSNARSETMALTKLQ